MADFVDLQYVNLLAGRLPRFQIKHRNPLKVNFRCPICGDSQKSHSKARGWIVESQKTNSLFYNCFNCGASYPFSTFLKLQDASLYNDYVAEKYLKNVRETPKNDVIPNPEAPRFDKNPLRKIKKISQLNPDHPAKKYIIQRQIPSIQHYRLYYAPKFKTWINSVIPNKFPPFKKDEPRLILPFLNKQGKCFGVSARGFDPNSLRYITIMFEDVPKIFGLDQVDFTKPTIITEGALDSLFLPNAIAMAGADLNPKALDSIKSKKEDIIFCFDNEPRNSEIIKRMEKIIEMGYKVCIWTVPQNHGKDINEMILSGRYDSKELEKIIINNSFYGLEAHLLLRSWKRA